MTTRTGARIYRRDPRRMDPNACPHCFRVVAISPSGHRRRHFADGAPCTGGGVLVGEPLAVEVPDLPELVPLRLEPEARRRGRGPQCVECNQGPRRKGDGTFAAHRRDVEDPTSSYCPGGSPKSR